MANVSSEMKRFVAFVIEREEIRLRKEAGKPKPWTKDPILQKYKFCNIRREDDKVTRWIASNWRTTYATDPNLWFAMVIARFVNWPDSLDLLDYPHDGWTAAYGRKFRRIMERSGKTWGSAYMIRSAVGSKAEYLARDVLTPMWEKEFLLRPKSSDSLWVYHARLENCYGMGSFLAAQVVADLKYAPPLKNAPDWHAFAASGPGSLRGLNRLVGRDKDARWLSGDWIFELRRAQFALNARLPKPWAFLHAQDVQNCLCEWDKYERARLGEGRPKTLYHGDH